MQTRIENGAGPRFTGLGVWNVYFIIAFALAAFGYIELNLLGNALLMAWLLLPVGPKWLRILRGTLGVAAAAVPSIRRAGCRASTASSPTRAASRASRFSTWPSSRSTSST